MASLDGGANQPQTALFDPTITVNWSDNSPFNGFILLGLVAPGSPAYTEFFLGNAYYPLQRIPVFLKCPITNGIFNPICSILWNSSIQPPNTQYAAWYYDDTDRLISGPSSPFIISTATFTPPVPTLTVPPVGSTPPTPG